jgi:predicted dienelactone hydrolase
VSSPQAAETVTDVTEPPSTEPAATTPAPSTSTTAPPDVKASLEIVQPGPYKVGVQTITITDAARNRPLTVDVWFPLTAGVEGALHEYTLVPGSFYRSPAAISATPTDAAGDGPFPLVVYSHGSGGIRYVASYYTEMIASHGYIVVAPDHTGNTATDRIAGSGTEFDVTAFNRPNDVKVVIDAMVDPANAEAGAFAALVDPERIAVTGHSFGGFTSLAVASGYTNSLGTFAADPRVDAIIPLAPASGTGDGRLLSDADLAAIKIPTMLIVGTDDKTTPVDPNITRAWAHFSSSTLYRIELVAAEHQSFTDICDYQEFLPSLPDVLPIIIATIEPLAVEGCSPDDMPIDRAKDLTNTFAIQFLESVFRDGPALDIATLEVPQDVLLQVK